MEIKNGVVEKIYDTDCAYDEAIVPDRVTVIGSYSANGIPAKKVSLPNSILNIGEYAFLECENLEEINIPNGVKRIGERAFFGCKNLKKITLPNSIEYIGPSTFCGCENLEEIILPNGIKKINYRTFADCKKLKRIVIPEGVEEIDFAAFSGCHNLEEIVLPSTLKTVSHQVFLNCKKLKKINLPPNITHLPDYFFKGCLNLDLDLPENITSLGKSVFEECYNLTHFPPNVYELGDNCFKKCRSLKDVTLNAKISTLPDGCFDGCVNLSNIYYPLDNLTIGKKCFRNCKSLTQIPDFIKNYNKRAFENCTGLTQVNITSPHIPMGCFRGCSNIKTFSNTDLITLIESFAFSGCKNLEEMSLKNINNLSSECFSNCSKLSCVNISPYVKKIGSRSFFNCINLKDFNLPDEIEKVGKEAFRNCHSITNITIPSSLNDLGLGAFSWMDSLETIYVSPNNKTFMTPDNKILINEMQQKLVLYASGIKDQSYSLKDYNVEIDGLNRELIKPIMYIGPLAFAGSKHLEELTVCGCTSNIEYNSFADCPKLKKLNIEGIPLFTCPGFSIRVNGSYYQQDLYDKKAVLPFETVEFSGNLVAIYTNALAYFDKVKEIILPKNGSYAIGVDAFSDCAIETLTIPNSVNRINIDSLPAKTKVIFENGINHEGLISMAHHDDYFGDYKLYEFDDGTYYIEKDDKITTITKQDIEEICSNSEFIINNPILFLSFMNDLIEHDYVKNYLLNGLLMAEMSINARKTLFERVDADDTFFGKALEYSGITNKNTCIPTLLNERFNDVIDFIEILKKNDVTEKVLYNRIFMTFCNKQDFEELLTLDRKILINIINKSKLVESNENSFETQTILATNLLREFYDDVVEYGITDPLLISKIFILNCKNPLEKKLFKYYNANIKRALINSGVFADETAGSQNLHDLLNLFEITGALSDDPIRRQRAITFIMEKILADKFENGKKNECRIYGDDLHRIFNFRLVRDEFDEEFADFFLENYQELYKLEKEKSGYIERIYNNFRNISKTATSNKGSQRKLKVLLEKCINYLSNNKFDNVTNDNKDLAQFIGEWYDSNYTWLNALQVLNEAKLAPRNIFTKNKLVDGKRIFKDSSKYDLREEISDDFAYEWLPKQDPANLILGKYCSCCAHLEGAGRGIMRASMILDNCQNLIIRNENGEIIAKSTLYVNRDERYAVFNNVETSLNYRQNNAALLKIYKTFIRGTQAFIDTYNKNNPEEQLEKVTIGANRNTILNLLEERNDIHPVVPIHRALEYGQYSLNGSGYAGDWKVKQRLVLVKEKKMNN